MKLQEALKNAALMSVVGLCTVTSWHVYQLNHADLIISIANRNKPNRALAVPAPEVKINMSALNTAVPANGKPGLLIFLASGCGYCKKSVPLYRDLMEVSSIKFGKVQMVALFSEPEDKAKEYLKDNKIVVQRIVPGLQFSTVGVQSTPTIVLVKDGKVLNQWVGWQAAPEGVIREVKKLS